jgi:pyruvate-formate lyase-activating enzyme
VSNIIEGLRQKYPDGTLIVEPTNACNLRCPLCSTGSFFDKKPKGLMDFDQYRRFIDLSAPILNNVQFHGSGDPFRHPRILEFLSYTARQKRLFTQCRTNGMWDVDPEALVRSGFHQLRLDVDGVTQAQHEKYRVGSKLDKVIGNAKAVLRARKRLHLAYPIVYLDTLIGAHNENDFDAFVQQARDAGADGITLQGMFDDLYGTSEWLPTKDRFKLKPRPEGRYDCPYKRTLAGVLGWDGELKLCCMNPHHEEAIVKLNAFETPKLLEAMDAAEFLEITRKAGEHDYCASCVACTNKVYEELIPFHQPNALTLRNLINDPIVWMRQAADKGRRRLARLYAE